MVNPVIVAGINALGRGQDRDALGQFLTIISQTMGPEAVAQYINPEEVIKRIAVAQGIDILNLVRSMQEIQQEQQAMQQQQQANIETDQRIAMAKTPMLDPSKQAPPTE